MIEDRERPSRVESAQAPEAILMSGEVAQIGDMVIAQQDLFDDLVHTGDARKITDIIVDPHTSAVEIELQGFFGTRFDPKHFKKAEG